MPHPRLFDYGLGGNECYCTAVTSGGVNTESLERPDNSRGNRDENNNWNSWDGGEDGSGGNEG